MHVYVSYQWMSDNAYVSIHKLQTKAVCFRERHKADKGYNRELAIPIFAIARPYVSLRTFVVLQHQALYMYDTISRGTVGLQSQTSLMSSNVA